MTTQDKSGFFCRKCGDQLLGDEPLDGHCLACLLDGAQDPEGPASATGLFDHYRLDTHPDGTPVELGRGAMGITYRAFDINLRCPVTLKVINKNYLGDELARLRFLPEARNAAKLRHSNVASLLHLGKSSIEAKLALEIASQVAAGLGALYKQKLVHRDIEPSNIMVSLEEGSLGVVKIIDLGLAKAVEESPVEMAISITGGFAGTPEFASPEQFAGVGVDIRSDLYALGVTLWTMLKGKTPFRGTPAELMYQHQHAPLPLEELKGVPQPVSVLMEVMLDKDPGRRFDSPTEFLNVTPNVIAAIAGGRTIARQTLQKKSPVNRVPIILRQGPERISVARLPVTGNNFFGREEDIAFLDAAWANQQINVVTIVAWAGVGKSTLVNHWLRRMATEDYRAAEFVFGWSFYRQGTEGQSVSADEFLDAALTWFGDPEHRLGTAWAKGERLAKLIAYRRTLLILDGLEPLQNPPGSQEGRLCEPSLQALLRELAAFNAGLCVVTTRLPVADIADQIGPLVLRRNLEHLPSDAGAHVLRALGVKGREEELRSVSDEFSGHCLTLSLLGSYLTDAYKGDIRRCKELSEHLARDVRQGAHARKVMESYQTWFGEGAELSVLRLLGLFDRPADENAIGTLLKLPAIPGLTESLTDLDPGQWQTILGKLRRAGLLAGEDPRNPGDLDTHPLVRQYFGEQLRSQSADAFRESNRRLYNYYRAQAPELPNSFREMEPLFLAVICGCNAGLFHEALHEVYISRIQRGNACFAANVLGARGALLSALVHFFEHSNWRSPLEAGIETQSLTPDDQLIILMQAAQYLTAARGLAVPEMRICYERAERLCHSLDRPPLVYVALLGQWRYSINTGRLPTAMRIAERVHSSAQKQNDPALMIGGYVAMAITLYFLGDFEAGHQYTMRGVQVWHSGAVRFPAEEVDLPVVSCLCYEAMFKWHFGQIASCHETLAEAISVAKELNDLHALAVALSWAQALAQT
jgi:serine/threonine protein kinase